MPRKEKFTRTGRTCPLTGAEIVQITVKVKDKNVVGERRLFTDAEQLGFLSDDDLLQRANYAEDLLARAAITRANTDEVGKKKMRTDAREHWRQNDKPGFTTFFVDESHNEAEINARLEKYYEEHLAE